MAQTPTITKSALQIAGPEFMGQRSVGFGTLSFASGDQFDNQAIPLDFRILGMDRVDHLLFSGLPRFDTAQIPAGTQFKWNFDTQSLELRDSSGTLLAATVVLTNLVIDFIAFSPEREK